MGCDASPTSASGSARLPRKLGASEIAGSPSIPRMLHRALVLVLALPLCVTSLRLQPCLVRTRTIAMKADKDTTSTAGRGFGDASSRYAAEEARGMAALEKMAADVGERGYDASLQGLQDRDTDPEPTPEELEKFKSQLTLGLAGFLILGGVLSLLFGGAIWDDSAKDAPDNAAFGFAPTQADAITAPPTQGEAPSWASTGGS